MRLAEGLGQSASQKKTEGNVRDAVVLNLLTSGCPPRRKDSRHQPRSWQCAYPRQKDQLGAPLFEIKINGIHMMRPSQRKVKDQHRYLPSLMTSLRKTPSMEPKKV